MRHVFDPVALARHEFGAWVGYYTGDWAKVARGAYGMVREGFGLTGADAIRATYCVGRANQVWAPVPDNDPDGARAYMRRFYEIVVSRGPHAFEPAQAAWLEVEWWRVHRAHQRQHDLSEAELTDALARLYSYVYDAPPHAVRPAAEHRMVAMRHSDAWVAQGCRPQSPHLAPELASLVASYRALARIELPGRASDSAPSGAPWVPD